MTPINRMSSLRVESQMKLNPEEVSSWSLTGVVEVAAVVVTVEVVTLAVVFARIIFALFVV